MLKRNVTVSDQREKCIYKETSSRKCTDKINTNTNCDARSDRLIV